MKLSKSVKDYLARNSAYATSDEDMQEAERVARSYGAKTISLTHLMIAKSTNLSRSFETRALAAAHAVCKAKAHHNDMREDGFASCPTCLIALVTSLDGVS